MPRKGRGMGGFREDTGREWLMVEALKLLAEGATPWRAMASLLEKKNLGADGKRAVAMWRGYTELKQQTFVALLKKRAKGR